MTAFQDTGVDSVHVSGYITADTRLAVRTMTAFPGEAVVLLGEHMPTIHLHATNEQLTRLRDVLSEHLAREGGA